MSINPEWITTQSGGEYTVASAGEGAIEIAIDDMPGTQGPGCSLLLNRAEAIALARCINSLAGVE
jgi:hypothetical protein